MNKKQKQAIITLAGYVAKQGFDIALECAGDDLPKAELREELNFGPEDLFYDELDNVSGLVDIAAQKIYKGLVRKHLKAR